MPGFIDGHTHMDMPFGGTVTADDWDTGTAAAVAGGTTTLVDFSLQDPEGTLGEAVETWQGKAEGKAHIDFGLHVAITNLTEDVKRELPSLPALGVATIKIFMAYKGTPLYTADEDLFEAMQIARECGLLVLVHAENGDAIAKLQAQALARGDTEPIWHATRARRPSRPRRRTARSGSPRSPTARCSSSTSPAPRRSRRSSARTRAAARCTPRPARSTSCSPTTTSRKPDFEGAKYVLLPAAARPVQPARAVARACRARTCTSSARTTARSTSTGRRSWASDDFTLIPNGAPGAGGARAGAVDARRARGARSARTCWSPCWRRTRRRCTAWPAARARSRPAPTPTSSSGTRT